MNLPKLAGDKDQPSRSVQVLFLVGVNIKQGFYFYNCNKFCTIHHLIMDSYYCDQVIEWWPMPELGTGNKII